MTQIWDSSPRIKRLTHQEALKMPPSWFKRHLEAIRASGGTAHPMAGKRGVVARINRVRLKCGGINSASGGIKYTRMIWPICDFDFDFRPSEFGISGTIRVSRTVADTRPPPSEPSRLTPDYIITDAPCPTNQPRCLNQAVWQSRRILVSRISRYDVRGSR
jgi:hypothetical protein